MLGLTGETVIGKNDPTAIEWPWISSLSVHAEMAAILNYLRRNRLHIHRRKSHKIPKYRVPSTLYVIGYYHDRLQNSRPCNHCIQVMRFYGVKKVIYSTGKKEEDAFLMEYVDRMEMRHISSGNRKPK